MTYPFVQAAHYRSGGNFPVNRVVIHTAEAQELPTTAEAVARYFQTTDRQASAHYCVDSNSIVQCVREQDTAFHAPPNQHSIGIEHAGYARQTAAEWADTYSVTMLKLSAALCREICDRHHIPMVWLSVADLLNGARGVTSHANVSAAWHQSSHTDPGPAFPAAQYMTWVNQGGSTVITADIVKLNAGDPTIFIVLGAGEQEQFLCRLSPADYTNLGSPGFRVLAAGDALQHAVTVGARK